MSDQMKEKIEDIIGARISTQNVLEQLGNLFFEDRGVRDIDNKKYLRDKIVEIYESDPIDDIEIIDIVIYAKVYYEYSKTAYKDLILLVKSYDSSLKTFSDSKYRGRTYRLIANTYNYAGFTNDAIFYAYKSYNIFKDDQSQDTMSSLNSLGNCYNLNNGIEFKVKLYHEVIEIAKKLDKKSFESVALNNLAHVKNEVGAYNEAIDHIEEALQLLEYFESKYHETWFNITYAQILLNKGEYEQAIKRLDLLDKEVYLKNHNYIILDYHLTLIRVKLTSMSLDGLEDTINDAIEMSEKLDMNRYTFRFYELKSQFYALKGNFELAYESRIKYDQARNITDGEKQKLYGEILKIKYETEIAQEENRKLNALADQLNLELKDAMDAIIDTKQVTLYAIAALAEVRDEVTGKHVFRTTELTRVLCHKLLEEGHFKDQLNSQSIELISRASALHDIGKIAVKDYILNKKGKLNAEEFEQIKMHATYGEYALSIVESVIGRDAYTSMSKSICLNHHEKWNGQGYPNALKENDIPLEGRLVAIVDVYDALMSKRPYKEAFSHEKSIQIIESESGQHFDPRIASVFVKHQELFKNILDKHADE